jgi:hypothetical protein
VSASKQRWYLSSEDGYIDGPFDTKALAVEEAQFRHDTNQRPIKIKAGFYELCSNTYIVTEAHFVRMGHHERRDERRANDC